MFDEVGDPRLSSTHVAALRISIASLCMLPFVLRGFWKNLRQYSLPLILAGWFGNGMPAFLFTIAQTELASSITGILNALTPLFTLIIAMLIFRKRYPVVNYIGIFVGLVGAIFLVSSDRTGISSAPIWAYAAVAAATVCYAISVNVIKNKLNGLTAIQVTGLAMVWVSPWCIAYLWIDGFFGAVIQSNPMQEGLPYVAALGILGTAVALILFNQLIKISSALFSSSVTYLIPVVAILWGFIDHESITIANLLYTLVILSGLYMVNLKTKKKPQVLEQ